MSDTSFYYDILCSDHDIRKKDYTIMRHIKYMLIRTLGMFEYTGLPDTIPQHILEMYLQYNGYCGITEYAGNLYALRGGLGGKPNYNYEPTIFTFSNPDLNYSANLKINEECVIIKNDDLYTGLLPMYKYYSSMLAENELSMFLADVNSRVTSLLSACDDSAKASAEQYLKNIEKGNLGVIADPAFLDGIRVQPYATGQQNQTVKTLLEYEQYLKASWFNELGLDANYNMKRETLTDSENEMNKDSLLPLVERMLHTRKECIQKVNDLYGTNITVDFAGQWKQKEIEEDLMHDIMQAEAEQAEETGQEEKEITEDVTEETEDERKDTTD